MRAITQAVSKQAKKKKKNQNHANPKRLTNLQMEDSTPSEN